MAGTYILQTNRAAFNQNAVDDTCRLCNELPETMPHFLLMCSILAVVREPIISEIEVEYETITGKPWTVLPPEEKTSTIIDCTNIIGNIKVRDTQKEKLNIIEFQCRRLLFALHKEQELCHSK